jgi:hypothetical protein
MASTHANARRSATVFAAETIYISVQVDAQAILGNPQIPPQNVVFMTDNNGNGGSTNEGSYELNTACHPGDMLVWNLTSISGNKVEFVAMRNSSGNVFGWNPPSGSGTEYAGTIAGTGSETYQILINVTPAGGNAPVQYSWDPYITST